MLSGRINMTKNFHMILKEEESLLLRLESERQHQVWTVGEASAKKGHFGVDIKSQSDLTLARDLAQGQLEKGKSTEQEMTATRSGKKNSLCL